MNASDAVSFDSELDDPLPDEAATEPVGESWGEELARRFGWVVLIVAGFVAYANAFKVPFVFDGFNYIVEKEWIGEVWSGKPGAIEKFFVESQTRVLAYFTFACDYSNSMSLTTAFPSLSPTPTGHYVPVWHTTSLAIHLAAALALYGIARHGFRSTRLGGRYARSAERIALTAALLWVVHPLDTQSVTYLYQRHESLMGMCYFFTLYLFIRFTTAERRPWGWALATVFACVCGMGAKEAMATAPLVVLWYDRVFIADGWRQIMQRRGWLHAALFATLSLLVPRMLATPYAAAGIADLTRVTPQEYAMTQFGVVRHYMYLSVYPVELNIDYAWRKTVDWPLLKEYKQTAVCVAARFAKFTLGGDSTPPSAADPPADQVDDAAARPLPPYGKSRFPYISFEDLKFENGDWRATVYPGVFVLGLVLLTMIAVVRLPAIGFLAGTFFVILAPTSTIVPIVDYCFEHRMYVPLASILTLEIVVADVLLTQLLRLLGRLLAGAAARAGRSPATGRIAAKLTAASVRACDPWTRTAVKFTLVVALATALTMLTLRRNYDYRSQTALWGDAQEKAPRNGRAKYNHGVYLQIEGTKESMDQAIVRYFETLKLDPNYSSAHLNLANIYLYRGELESAKRHYLALLAIEPMHSQGRLGLADTLFRAKLYADAKLELERLIHDEPNNGDADKLLKRVVEEMEQARGAPSSTAPTTSPKPEPNAT